MVLLPDDSSDGQTAAQAECTAFRLRGSAPGLRSSRIAPRMKTYR